MIYASGIVSLIVQFVVGIVDYVAINIEVHPRDELLKDLLSVELYVQVIEFLFYVWLIYYYNQVSRNITPFRYLDWAITTPLMLISLSAFLSHDGTTTRRLGDFLWDNTGSIVKIVTLNALMLLCGLIGEFGYLSHYTSTALGTIPFILNFKYIKDTFLPSSDDGFGDETDGMGMFESEKKNKPNPWSICHSQVGPKKSRKWERCVREVKKQLGEGKNPVSLFLEAQIMNIVERNLQPRITKRDLVKYLSEGDNFATKHLQSWGNTKPAKVKTEVGEQAPSTAPSKPKTSPTTKPGKPGTKPQRPPSPFKNPNPGEKESPKAKKVSPEKAKDEVIDVIMQLLQK